MKRIKRANGQGSITKRKRAKGFIWEIRVTNKETGQREKLGQCDTYKEANELLNEYILNPWDLERETTTIKEVYKFFIKTKKNSGVSEKTLKGYENDYKRCDQLHNIKIRELKTPYIRDFINTLKTKTGTSASDGTKKKTKIFISNLLQFALENELINRNVASFTMNNLKGKVKEKNIFTNEEIKELWELSKSYYFARVILVMIYTGLRISEIRGLKRESINILQGTIINSGIKTEKGKNRTIFIHKDIKPVIMKLIQESKNDYLIYGDFKIKAREKNKSVSKTYFEKKFKEICNILGVVHTPHDTRHTFTTILYRNGLKDKYIIDLVGHTDIKMTESNYIHLERKELQDSLNNIDFKVN